MSDKKVDVVSFCPKHCLVGMDKTIMLCGKRWCSACLVEALKEMDVSEIEMTRVEDSSSESGHSS
jgi:hypothetical protein